MAKNVVALIAARFVPKGMEPLPKHCLVPGAKSSKRSKGFIVNPVIEALQRGLFRSEGAFLTQF
jgi:hypothetical protein